MLHGQESSMQDRLHFMFLNFVGQHVTVLTVDGAIVEGLFVGAAEGKFTVILSRARYKTSVVHLHDDAANCRETLLIDQDQIVMMDAVDVQFRFGDVKGVNEGLRHMGMDFPMQRWAEIEDNEGSTLDEDIERTKKVEKKSKDKNWDQFEENAKKFGVKSTYNENKYTTPYNPREFTPEQHAAAEKMAREIEGSNTLGIQHRIERGEEVEDDEGKMYSDVNQPKTGAKKSLYVPPGKKSEPDATTQQPAAPTSVGDLDDRARVMATQQPLQRQTQPQEPGKSVAPPQPLGQAPQKPGLNARANEWKPGGMTANVPTSPVAERVIENMLETMAEALAEKMKIKSCPPDWPGDDLYYDEEDGPQGRYVPGGTFSGPQYGMPSPTYGGQNQMSPQAQFAPGQHQPPHVAMQQPPHGNYGHQQQHNFPGHQHQQFHQPHHTAQHPGATGQFPAPQIHQHHQIHQHAHVGQNFPQQRVPQQMAAEMNPMGGQVPMKQPQHIDPNFNGNRGGTLNLSPTAQINPQFQQSHTMPGRGGSRQTQPPMSQPQQPVPTTSPLQGGTSHATPPMPVDQSGGAAADPRRSLRGRGGGGGPPRQEEASRPGPPGSSVETGKKKK